MSRFVGYAGSGEDVAGETEDEDLHDGLEDRPEEGADWRRERTDSRTDATSEYDDDGRRMKKEKNELLTDDDDEDEEERQDKVCKRDARDERSESKGEGG